MVVAHAAIQTDTAVLKYNKMHAYRCVADPTVGSAIGPGVRAVQGPALSHPPHQEGNAGPAGPSQDLAWSLGLD